MSELIIPPSPNWFLSNCLSVGTDGFVVYGTLSTDIAVLIPNESSPLFFSDVKIIQSAHKDRVTCIDICPNWLTSRLFISGADDGYVKLWSAETFSNSIAHNTHSLKKESVVCASFLDANRILSIGSLSMLALWNLKSNNVQRDQNVLKFFKPICMSVCPHKPNTVAVGTRQGVVVVLSISDKISIVYKAPGHNAEITSLSWCPTLECEYLDRYPLKTTTKQFKSRVSKSIQDRLERQIDSVDDDNRSLDEVVTKVDILDEEQPKLELNDFLKDCKETLELIKSSKNPESDFSDKQTTSSRLVEAFDEYGRSKLIPKILKDDEEKLDGTLNDTVLTENETINEVADESDIFDIYTDNNLDEFGHTKYVSQNEKNGIAPVTVTPIINKIKPIEENVKENGTKEQNEIDTLVNTVNSMHLNGNETTEETVVNGIEKSKDSYYLASCCKNGSLCIWRWGGMLILSQALNKTVKKKLVRKATHPYGAIYWYKSEEIIAASKESQLISIKFSADDMKTTFRNIHNEHKRGLFRITSNIQGTTTDTNISPIIWTASMDRLLAAHLINNNVTNVYSTLGGYVYDIQISPIDSTTFAIGAGDGTIRIWRLIHGKSDDNVKVKFVKQFWNNISGKVLNMAWHPTKEKCLAFTTYEGRIGLLDISTESPARLFPLSLCLGAFHICWDSINHLFACGGDMLVVYDATHHNKEPQKIAVTVCGENWETSTMSWTSRYLSVGSPQGGFALMKPEHPYEVVAATFPHKKRIQSIEWHPSAVSTDDNDSPCADLIAVAANAKNLVILKVVESEGETKLDVYLDMEIHSENIISICWSPHHNGRILSTSKDYTVQIWDVINKCLLHTFIDHQNPALSAVWCPLSTKFVMSSGGDYTLRIWDINKHPPQENVGIKRKQKKKSTLARLREFDDNLATLQMEYEELNKTNGSEAETKISNGVSVETIELATVCKTSDKKSHKKNYPLVNFWKNYREISSGGCRLLFNRIKSGNVDEIDYSDGMEYLKIYGKRNDIISILDNEQNFHKETYNWNALAIIGVLSGDLRGSIEYAASHNKLNTSLLSLAPSISHRFWKEMLLSYISQIEGEDPKKVQDTSVNTLGNIWQGMLLITGGKFEEGCMALSTAGLHAEAICAARARNADHIAEKHIKIWSDANISSSNFSKAAECLLSLGLVKEAAYVLGKSNEETELALAAEIAKHAGNSVLADSLSNNV